MEIQTQKYSDTQNLKHDNIMRLNTKLSKIMEIFLKDGPTVNYNPYFSKNPDSQTSGARNLQRMKIQ